MSQTLIQTNYGGDLGGGAFYESEYFSAPGEVTGTINAVDGPDTFPAATTAGSTLVAVCSATCAGGTFVSQSITTGGLTWILAATFTWEIGAGTNLWLVISIYYCPNAPSISNSTPTQWSVTANLNAAGGSEGSDIWALILWEQLYEFGGMPSNVGVDAFATATGTTGNPQTANLATTETDVVICCMGFMDSWAAGSGYTVGGGRTGDSNTGSQYQLNTAPGSVATAFGASSYSGIYGCVAVALGLSALPPTVTAVTPPSGPTAGGTAVIITGTNFVTGATVSFGGNAATSVVVQSSTEITCVTPPGAAGYVTVSVTTSGGTGSLADGYLYIAPEATGQVYERRYACNGIFDSSQKYGDVVRALALSMAGWAVPPGPSWQIYAGVYVPPTVSLGDSDLRGLVKGDFRISVRNVCNGVKGTFVPSWLPINPGGPTVNAPAAPAWRETDFPPYQDSAAVAQDGGIPIWKDIKLDFTTSLWMAQRIAKIICEQLRRQQTISPQFKVYALQNVAGDVMEFTHERWGLLAATYQIQSMALTADPGQDKVPALGVDLVLRQTDAGVYFFNPPTGPTEYGDYSPYGSTGIGANDIE